MPKKASSTTITASKKRSIARRFNDVLAGGAIDSKATDGRKLRRLERYRAELKRGKTKLNVALTPLDVAMRVDELLAHGDSVTALRRLRKPMESSYDRDTMVVLLQEMHPVYDYRPTAYRFAGIDDETLLAAGIIDRIPPKRGPKKGTRK